MARQLAAGHGHVPQVCAYTLQPLSGAGERGIGYQHSTNHYLAGDLIEVLHRTHHADPKSVQIALEGVGEDSGPEITASTSPSGRSERPPEVDGVSRTPGIGPTSPRARRR